MAEVKYEHPLDYYTVNNFVEESRKLIGKPAISIFETPTYNSAKLEFVSGYARALGDDNPIFTDIIYAVKTKYATLIAPHTFLFTFKYPVSQGVLFNGPYPLVGFEAEYDWEWNNVVKMNDGFTTEHVLKDVYERFTPKGRTIYLVSECKYFNKLSKELTATCIGTYAAIARAESIMDIPEAITEGFVKHPVTDRKVYYHSDEEVERTVKDIRSMVRRGSKPLYWENVNAGDKLPQVVKGPLTTADLVYYHNSVFSAKAFPNFGVHLRKWLKTPGALRMNPMLGWPYDIQYSGAGDPIMGGASGLPYSYGQGSLKAGFCAHLLSNWMGDDGFIRRMKVDVLEPYIYGDALWIRGEVVDKYKEKIGGSMYGAVDIKVETMNQLNQNVAPGTATVYLPFTNSDIDLPIPQ